MDPDQPANQPTDQSANQPTDQSATLPIQPTHQAPPSTEPHRSEAALPEPVLNPWNSGPAVAELQELLCGHGFHLAIDGNYGWITEVAVKNFQRQHGLRVDGVVNSQTWAALKSTIAPGCRVLRQGHTGADVREIQGLLLIHGYDLNRDGVFGEKTRRAVLAFQTQNRLRATGLVDLVTWNLLRGVPLPAPPKRSKWFFDTRRWW